MSLNLNVPKADDEVLKPRIAVVGIGGAGGNAVNNMIRSNLEGVEFLTCNTDAQALSQSLSPHKIQLGRSLTRGLGAGAKPDVGRAAAEESLDDIMTALNGANMVFLTAGMGGGTGTGAAPVIARACREAGVLTIGVITKPFHFEGVHRMRLAEQGIQSLTEVVDTLIIIPNQNLFRIANEKTTFADAFKMADDVLEAGVRGVTDLMVLPGLINLDFNDIRTVMTEMGKAMMGNGEAEGEGRAIAAAEAAISNPLLDDVSMRGARGVLINITGGADLTLFEVDEAANKIREQVDPEANIIFGSTFDERLQGRMRVSIVATGIDSEVARENRPATLTLASERARRPQAVMTATATAPQPSYAPVRETTNEPTFVRTAPQATPQMAPVAAAPEPIPSYRVEPQPAFAQRIAQMTSQSVTMTATAEDLSWQQETVELEETAEIEAPAVEENAVEEMAAEIESRADSFPAPLPSLAAEAKAPLPMSTASDELYADTDQALRAMQQYGQQAAPAKQPTKAPSLFARVTGAARFLAQPAEAKRPEPQLDQRTAQRAAAAVRASQQPAVAPRPAAPAPSRSAEPRPVPAQPRLNLDPAERRASAGDEHLLDIPAFLRRQAN